MSFLFKVGFLEIDLGMILSFLLGLLIGAVLICLIYAILVVASLGSKKFVVKTEEDSLTAGEVKDMVVTAQKAFKDKSLRGELSRVEHCKSISKDLVYGIASRFYPNSKYPLLEISIDEAIILVGYIQKRVDELLDRRVIRLLKKLKISSIVSLTQKTNQVMDSKIYKVGKEINGAISVVKKFANAFNPAWWFRKLVVDNVINVILDKLCQVIIAVVGEETYKIYSKKVFNLDVEIETNVEELMNSIDKEIAEAKKEAAKEMNNDMIAIDPGNMETIMYKKKVYTQNKGENNYLSIFDSNRSYKMKKQELLAVNNKLTREDK